jgi:hypothetical protein
MTLLFDLFFARFEARSPWLSLTVLSVLTSAIMLVVFKMASNQAAIKDAKERIKGRFLEIRLFQHDPIVVFSSLGRILLDNFRHLRYSTAPLFFMLIPVIVILTQADMRYGVRPLHPGEHVVFKVKLKEEKKTLLNEVKLILPDGVNLSVDAVRMPGENEVDWDLNVAAADRYEIKVSVGKYNSSHELVVSSNVARITKARAAGNILSQFLNPGLPPLPEDSPFEKIELSYPPRELKFYGRTIPWMLAYFIISVVFGFGVKDLFGVEV